MGMDSLYGFGILFLIPLLFWFQRSRQKVRIIDLSVFPIIESLHSIIKTPPRRLTRFSRRWRYILLTLAFGLLSLAFNGLHLRNMEDIPGEWLVVMDNTFSAQAIVEGKSLYRIGVEELGDLVKSLNSRDTYSLFLTSPDYDLQAGLDRRNLLSVLNGRTPAYPFPSSDEAIELTHALLKSTPFKGTIVISPRSQKWRKDLKDDDITRPMIFPEDTPLLKGNTGIVSFDLTASGPGTFDLFFRTASRGLKTDELGARLHLADRSILDLPVPLDEKGEGRVVARGLDLPAGRISLELDVDDLLRQDNRVTAMIAPGAASYAVDLGKHTRPFIRKALLAERKIKTASIKSSAAAKPLIRVLDGELPGQAGDSPYLIIFPTGDFFDFSFRKILTSPLTASFDPIHPVTRQLNFRDFRPSKIAELRVPEGFEIIGNAEGTPLIAVGEVEGTRVVVWSFDPEDNGIYLDPSFPILALESVRWLAGDRGVTWDRGFGCTGGTRTDTALPDPSSEGSNILCPEVTLESGMVTMPRLPRISLSDPLRKIEVRTDLTRHCLFFALIILLILAADSAVGRKNLP